MHGPAQNWKVAGNRLYYRTQVQRRFFLTMSQSIPLFKKTALYAIGNFSTKIISIALVSIFSFYLTKSEYGVLDLIVTSITFLVPLITLQIGDAVYRNLFYSTDEKKETRAIISTGLLYVCIASAAFSLFFFTIIRYFDFDHKTPFCLLLASTCLLAFFLQTVRALGYTKLYAAAGILNSIFLLILSSLLLVTFETGIYGALLASFFSNIVAILFLTLKGELYKYISPAAASWRKLKELVKYSWPLVPNTISWFLITLSDRFIILYWLGTSANGIFAVSTKFPSLIMMINSIFILAVQDHALEGEKSKSLFNSKFFETYVKFEFSIIYLFILASPFIAKILLADDFYIAWKYMPLLYISTSFMAFSSYLGAYYLKEKNTKGLFYTTIAGALVNLLCSGGGMPFIGLYAPALGSLVSFIVIYVLRYNFLKRRMDIEINHALMAWLLAPAMIFTLSLYYLSEVLILALLIVATLIFLHLNKKLIKFFSSFLTSYRQKKST